MKILLTAIIGIGFVSIAVFGLFAMGQAADHGNCIAATLQGRACTATDVFGVASYHLSAFQKAARAALSDISAFAARLVFVLLIFAAAISALHKSGLFKSIFAGVVPAGNLFTPQKKSLWRWLSFHENSPNFAIAR